jgi:NTE family protein
MNDGQDQAKRHVDFLLLGGGVASATAAETLRHEGAEGSILLVSDEPELPYHRPPLTTRFLLGDQSAPVPLVLTADYYRDREIEVQLAARVSSLDPKNRLVSVDGGESISYGKLLIATGARPVRIKVPGSALPGVQYLRTLADARAILHVASTARHAVVVGSGFISLELAAAFVQRGLRVTLIAKKLALFDKLDDPALVRYFFDLFSGRGVEVILDDTVAAFRGDGRVETVVTRTGRAIATDFAAIAIGVTPDVGFLDGSGIAVDDGIVADRHLQTNYPDVYAAGDVANFFDPVFKVHHRIEHWDNAVKQGRLVAKNMLGQRLPYDEVSYFACQLFDFGFQFLGLADNTNSIARIGSLQDRSCALLYLHNDVPRALFSTGRPARETRAIESLIRHRTNIGYVKEKLSEPGFALTHVPSQTAIILQGGGALGAFECGVVHALEDATVFPDIVAGVSIGAFNGAIIASNPRRASQALEAFWDRLALIVPELPEERSRRLVSSWQALAFGVPRFFRPRWAGLPFMEPSPLAWTSLYDPTPVKELLAEYVDFEFLGSSPVRLLVSAVNVETARLEVFDSYVDTLTPDHILASGSLPPGFPWTTINGKHYWDGGIISNSPLDMVIERTGAARKRIFIVNLFPNKQPLPTNLIEVQGRRDEIVYTERIRRDSAQLALVSDFRKLVDAILAHASTPAGAAEVRQWPAYSQLMGDEDPKLDITRITRAGSEGEPASKDYDFSRTSIANHMRAGYDMAKLALQGRATP